MGKETSIGVGWTLHGDGTTHLISQPSAADIATLKEIEPSEARIYLIDAVVDGKHYSDVIAVGTMIVLTSRRSTVTDYFTQSCD